MLNEEVDILSGIKVVEVDTVVFNLLGCINLNQLAVVMMVMMVMMVMGVLLVLQIVEASMRLQILAMHQLLK